MPSTKVVPIPDERIVNRIVVIRDKKVLLDRDLADLYGVTTSNLNKAVARNHSRFPEDFMFRLNKEEFALIFQNGTSRWGGTRKLPLAFTEQGVAMLSSVLNSARAIQVNIQIIRMFVKFRELLTGYRELREKIEAMEKKYDHNFRVVFEAIKRLVAEEEKPKKTIGFQPVRKKA